MKGKATKYGCKKRVKGQCPLRGQGAELPCGVWGNAPTAFRALNSKGTVSKGAGSEASLPVTSRVRRRASKLLFQHLCCVAPDGRDHVAGLATKAALSRKQGFRACGRDQRALRSPFGNLRRRNFWGYLRLKFMLLWESTLVIITGINNGVSGESKPPTPRLSYASFSTVIFPSVTFSRTRSPSAILPPSSSSLSVSSTVR